MGLLKISLQGQAGFRHPGCRPSPSGDDQWCWAASGEMVMDFLGVDVTQCDQANQRFNQTTCCQSSPPIACVQTGWPEFDEYDFTFEKTNHAHLCWDQIVNQISNERAPFCFTKKWTGNGGHMLVVYGYLEIDGERSLLVHDPLPVNVGTSSIIPYEEYISGADFTHWNDYYQIRLAATVSPAVAGGSGSMRVPSRSTGRNRGKHTRGNASSRGATQDSDRNQPGEPARSVVAGQAIDRLEHPARRLAASRSARPRLNGGARAGSAPHKAKHGRLPCARSGLEGHRRDRHLAAREDVASGENGKPNAHFTRGKTHQRPWSTPG